MRSALDMPHLELLIAVADSGSLNAAAEQLGLTQPALTYRLREAERRLGAALFVMGQGRRLRMTPSAERLLPSARRVLEELLRAEGDVHRFSGGIRYVVRVGVQGLLCPHWLPHFLRFLGQRADEITIELVPAALHRPLDALARGVVDVAVGYGTAVPKDWYNFVLFGDTLAAALPNGHPLAARRALAACDFAGETYVTHGPALEQSLEYQAVLAAAGVAPSVAIKSASLDAALDYVAAGLGVTIAGGREIARWRSRGRVEERPLDGAPVDIVWWAATGPERHAGSPGDTVADYLSLWCQEIMPNLVDGTDQPMAAGTA
jgi:LysR family transcriptional regulator, regulator for metE and metH